MHINFLSWSFEAFFKKKVVNLKRVCNVHRQGRFQVSFFSGDIAHLNRLGLHLFSHVAKASPEDNRLRALLAGN